MKSLFSASIFSALLAVFAAPGHAATISFTSSLAGGDVTTSTPLGPNDPILAYSGFFDTMTITGAGASSGTYGTLFLNELYDPNNFIMTVTGSVTMNGNPLPGLAGVTTLVTIDFANDLTANTSAGGYSLNFPTDVTSITISPTLLADLGSSGAGFSLTGLTDGAFIGGNPGSFTSVGPTMTLSQGGTATPEPGSWMLMGLGLVSITFLQRKRYAAAA